MHQYKNGAFLVNHYAGLIVRRVKDGNGILFITRFNIFFKRVIKMKRYKTISLWHAWHNASISQYIASYHQELQIQIS
jgi:hypothetical protein